MRRDLEMAIEEPEKWIELGLSGMNEADKGERPQKKCKMDLKPPEGNFSGNKRDYLSLFQGETRYISDTEKEPNNDSIKPLEEIKVKEFENKCSIIIEDGIYQVQGRDMKRRIKQRMEKVLEGGKLVKSENDLILYQKNN
ncbi:hypothetical protein O181_021574 [Austropuccinia psidii MF-1]|uniref:Uncharacterized protein n=1 Tax=Austropuccinia psidii MF-1 TaxID=1389203 RepID=A0A9Q3CB08_9BASI|nr:hypothetical protein [Austropuccinia psidii MF-1]